MNLLIVDDEYYTVESISNKIRTLRPDFFEIFCAYNLTQALEAFSAHPIDLMICEDVYKRQLYSSVNVLYE